MQGAQQPAVQQRSQDAQNQNVGIVTLHLQIPGAGGWLAALAFALAFPVTIAVGVAITMAVGVAMSLGIAIPISIPVSVPLTVPSILRCSIGAAGTPDRWSVASVLHHGS